MGEIELFAEEVEEEPYQEKANDPEDISDPDWPVFTHCQWDCHSHDEEEGGEDEICGGESLPLCVVQKPGGVGDWSHVVDQDHAHHGEPSVDIQRLYSYFGRGWIPTLKQRFFDSDNCF